MKPIDKLISQVNRASATLAAKRMHLEHLISSGARPDDIIEAGRACTEAAHIEQTAKQNLEAAKKAK